MPKPFAAITLLSGLFLSLCVARSEAQSKTDYQPRIDKDGWEILFDGKDTNAWRLAGSDPAGQTDYWKINAEGELCPTKPGPNLCTHRRYCDYVLELDFKLAAKQKSNSGVFIGVHDPALEVETGMEIQILDNADWNVPFDAGNANGSLYELVHPTIDVNRLPGEWNHFRITVKESNIVVEMNGKEIVRADVSRWTTPHQNPDGSHNKFPHAIGALPHEGFICLQNHGGTPVWFRNVRIKPLTDRQPKYTGKEPIEQVLQPPSEKKPAGK